LWRSHHTGPMIWATGSTLPFAHSAARRCSAANAASSFTVCTLRSEIVQFLGHTNPNITRGTDAKFSPDHLRKAAGALEI
jgi:hypothetical protein